MTWSALLTKAATKLSRCGMVLALILSAPAAAHAAGPTLGIPGPPNSEGFGEISPDTVFLGGDPTGLVTKVHWQGWGRSTAIGTGSATGSGLSVADGST